MNRNNIESAVHRAKDTCKGLVTKVGTAGTALLASGAAFAGGGSPGSAIAAELSGGKADVMLVIAAAAVIIGVLVLWAYVKRTR